MLASIYNPLLKNPLLKNPLLKKVEQKLLIRKQKRNKFTQFLLHFS
jgi:hypothetical protein